MHVLAPYQYATKKSQDYGLKLFILLYTGTSQEKIVTEAPDEDGMK